MASSFVYVWDVLAIIFLIVALVLFIIGWVVNS